MSRVLLALPPGHAHLWYVLLEDATEPGLLALYYTLMSSDERRRYELFRFENNRHEFLVTRALVRVTLSRYADVDPATWTFRANEYGRPEIAGPANVFSPRFNLSNTGGMVVCLVARSGDVGVDVEALDRRRRGQTTEIADRFFAPAEVAALRALPTEQQRYRFFEYWTLKEAYIKARGMGLSIPLAKFAFVLEPGSPVRITLDPSLGDEPSRWEFTHFTPSPGHLVAAAAQRLNPAGVQWIVRRTVPLAELG